MPNLFEKIDNKILAAKIEQGMAMLKNQSPEELSKRVSKVDKDEVMKKLDEIDTNKIKEMNIDLNKIKSQLTQADIEKVRKVAGKDGEQIVNKVMQILNNAGGK